MSNIGKIFRGCGHILAADFRKVAVMVSTHPDEGTSRDWRIPAEQRAPLSEKSPYAQEMEDIETQRDVGVCLVQYGWGGLKKLQL